MDVSTISTSLGHWRLWLALSSFTSLLTYPKAITSGTFVGNGNHGKPLYDQSRMGGFVRMPPNEKAQPTGLPRMSPDCIRNRRGGPGLLQRRVQVSR